MNLIFLTVYLILVPMQIYAVGIQKHPVTKLFTLSLILEFVSLVFMLTYYIQYTVGGTGNENIKTTGDILDILSRVNIDPIDYFDCQPCGGSVSVPRRNTVQCVPLFGSDSQYSVFFLKNC